MINHQINTIQEQLPGLKDQSLETEKPMTMGRGCTNKQRWLPQVSIGIKLHQLQEEAPPEAYWRALQPRPPFHTSGIISSILTSLMANYIWRLLNLHLHLQLSYLKACQVCSTYISCRNVKYTMFKSNLPSPPQTALPPVYFLWVSFPFFLLFHFFFQLERTLVFGSHPSLPFLVKSAYKQPLTWANFTFFFF